jgi:hypothetical protein
VERAAVYADASHTSNETLRRLERLHVRAWPASETARIGGWLWRWSGGGSQRANSVSTIDFTGNDPLAALDRVEQGYRTKGVVARLHSFDLSQPPELPALLAARGYGMGETTPTMLAVAARDPAGRVLDGCRDRQRSGAGMAGGLSRGDQRKPARG